MLKKIFCFTFVLGLNLLLGNLYALAENNNNEVNEHKSNSNYGFKYYQNYGKNSESKPVDNTTSNDDKKNFGFQYYKHYDNKKEHQVAKPTAPSDPSLSFKYYKDYQKKELGHEQPKNPSDKSTNWGFQYYNHYDEHKK